MVWLAVRGGFFCWLVLTACGWVGAVEQPAPSALRDDDTEIREFMTAMDQSDLSDATRQLEAHPELSNLQIYEETPLVHVLEKLHASDSSAADRHETEYTDEQLAWYRERVALLVAHGADLNKPAGPVGVRPLLLAIQSRLPEADVAYLIAHGADPAAVDGEGNGLMWYAAHAENPLPRMQLAYKLSPASLDAANKAGQSTLMCLLAHDRTNMGYSYYSSSEEEAERVRIRPLVKFLVAHGADLHQVDAALWTVLFYAVLGHDLALVQRCVDAGVDINAIGRQECYQFGSIWRTTNHSPTYPLTALDLEIMECYEPEITAYLLDHGAQSSGELNPSNFGHTTLLHQACLVNWWDDEGRGQPDSRDLRQSAMAQLLAHHWDPNVRDAQDQSPLFELCLNNFVDRIELLITYGADVNLRDKDGNTPLLVATLQATETLLAHGANPWLSNKDGIRPLDRVLEYRPQHYALPWYLDFDPFSKGPALPEMVQVLYVAQERPVNIGLWVAVALFLPGLGWYLRGRNRRRVERLKAAGADLAPDAVYADPQWKLLAGNFERAQGFHAVLVQHRLSMILPLMIYLFLCGVHGVDPVLRMLTGAAEWIGLAVVGGASVLLYGVLFVEKRVLRVGAAYVGFCVLGYGAGVFLLEGIMLIRQYELYAVGWLLIAGAVGLTPGLFQFYRIIKMDVALRRMKLPYKLGAAPVVVEAEEIEGAQGWDGSKKG